MLDPPGSLPDSVRDAFRLSAVPLCLPQVQTQQRSANHTRHAVRGQQQRGGSSSQEAARRREGTISDTWMPSTSTDFDSFGGWDSQSRHEVQDLSLLSMTSLLRELQDELARPIQGLKNALSEIEDKNETYTKAISWRLEQLESKVDRFLISVENTTALPIDWDGMAGQA
ncbi:hypothetical protein CKAH01_10717 [Colletotrichum kahawae]|uniref:Uncharacterized protein n=1 Tax=Colletotrichum kahawae TaxID=34407 RepID=A0AAD9XVI0_COLKA|nr:hypothetical protein CKAH01_10717 [Colletotrichum kahawae]